MSGWDGYPQDRERDSEGHVIRLADYNLIDIYRWDAAGQVFRDRKDRWCAPADLAADGDEYLGQIITPAQHAAEVEQARRVGTPFADLTSDEKNFGVILSTDHEGKEVRVAVNQFNYFDGRPAHITFGIFIGNHRWVEAELKPEDALKVVQLALLKPASRARGGSDAGY